MNDGDAERAKTFLQEAPDLVRVRDECGDTVLHLAVQKANEDLVRLFIACGANIHARGKDGKTPLAVASFKGHPNIVSILMSSLVIGFLLKRLSTTMTPITLSLALRGTVTKSSRFRS